VPGIELAPAIDEDTLDLFAEKVGRYLMSVIREKRSADVGATP
jgi:hypothetical protein